MRLLLAKILALTLWLGASGAAVAQGQPQAQQPELLKPEQLEQIVAQIALYPDALLANVLMASTYPLEVVQAARWVDGNKSLKGDALKSAVDKQTWDDSIKQLAATPTVLSMMSTKLDWTQQLGDAVLAQQPDVMDAVQRLRSKAQANNKLQNTKEQKVSTKTESNKQVIVIEPTQPDTIYVPYYDPTMVYGAWPYAAYPPYYYPPAGGYLAAGAIGFGLGFAVGAWANNSWGGGFGWGNNNINVNRNTNVNIGSGNNWQHNVDHRGGVRYNNKDVANRMNRGGDARNSAQNRMDFRGRDGNQVLNPGNRPGAGGGGVADRAGNRPSTGDRAGNRPGGGDRAGNRPGGGDRPGAGGGGQRRDAGNRGGGGGRGGGNAFSGAGGGAAAARAQSSRGHASLGGGGGGGPRVSAGGGGGARAGGGGGGARAGGGGGGRGGGGGGGGGRRSDMVLKHDIVRLGTLDNGLGFYRFAYNGSDNAYVGVMAQEVEAVMPTAVTRGNDGYLRVHYGKLGVKFQTYDQWLASGAHVPTPVRAH